VTPELGLIEGFFGRPYTWAERRAVAGFLAPRGYGFYLYAPKADAYLRRRWQEPHPVEEQAELAAFSAFCRTQGMRFGVGLTPFELQLHDGRDWEAPMRARLARLAEIGLDDLAILFDDMRGDVPALAERQAAIVAFAADAGIAARLFCCPSYYSDDPILDLAFGARPPHYLERLGALLDPAVQILWTGPEVVSREYAPGHLARVAQAIRRKPFLWDNYPVNDGPRMAQHLHLRAFTGRPAAIAPHLAGHGINLASQPHLGLVPACTLVESYREGEAYDYGAAFARAVRDVLGPALAERVAKDLLTLQDRGRDRLGDRMETLKARYAAYDHPAAAEILRWLEGAWEVDEELVQTQ
jgi:hyaluronoglucosaminidase